MAKTKKMKAPQPHPYALLMMEAGGMTFEGKVLAESSNPAYNPPVALEGWDPGVPGWVPAWFPQNGASPQGRLEEFIARVEKLAPSSLSRGSKSNRIQKLTLALLRLEYEVRTGQRFKEKAAG